MVCASYVFVSASIAIAVLKNGSLYIATATLAAALWACVLAATVMTGGNLSPIKFWLFPPLILVSVLGWRPLFFVTTCTVIALTVLDALGSEAFIPLMDIAPSPSYQLMFYMSNATAPAMCALLSRLAMSLWCCCSLVNAISGAVL